MNILLLDCFLMYYEFASHLASFLLQFQQSVYHTLNNMTLMSSRCLGKLKGRGKNSWGNNDFLFADKEVTRTS